MQTGAAACVAQTGLQHLGEALGPADGVAAVEQAHQRAGTERAAGVDMRVLARYHLGQFPAVGGQPQALGQQFGQLGAAAFVADVPRPCRLRGVAFAQVVGHASPAHRQRRVDPRALVQHQQQVQAGVDLGVVLGRLRHAPQAVCLGQQAGQRAAVAQHLEHPAGALRHQPARQFLPHPFGHQRIDLAVGHHHLQQRQGFWRHAEVGKAGRQSRHTQQTHRVFDEGRRDMAQHFRADVGLAIERVDQGAVLSLRNGVDGQVAAQQVFFQRHLGCGVHGEALVAAAGLAFGAGKGHFFAGLWVDEDREVFAHRPVAQRLHLLRRAAHDDPVAVAVRQAQQCVAHRAAHHVALHQRRVRSGLR